MNYLATFLIAIDEETAYYSRTVYSILDLTGQLGGVFEIFDIFGGIFIGLFADKLFVFSIISRLYQTKVNSHVDKGKLISLKFIN